MWPSDSDTMRDMLLRILLGWSIVILFLTHGTTSCGVPETSDDARMVVDFKVAYAEAYNTSHWYFEGTIAVPESFACADFSIAWNLRAAHTPGPFKPWLTFRRKGLFWACLAPPGTVLPCRTVQCRFPNSTDSCNFPCGTLLFAVTDCVSDCDV
jgi:hypothetical protein